MEEERRRVPRQNADWMTRFRLVGERRRQWHDCLVVDISALGIGLEFSDALPAELLGRRLVVEVSSPIGNSITVLVEAEVRYAAHQATGGWLVGAEFSGLSEMERSVLNSLELMQIAW